MKSNTTLILHLHFADCKRWWSIFLKPGFRHVACTVKNRHSNCPFVAGTEMFESARRIGVYKKDELSTKKCRIVEIKYNFPTRKRWFSYLSSRWGVFTCMCNAESILSLHKISLTPYRLYKKILHKNFLKKNPHIKSVKLIQTRESR